MRRPNLWILATRQRQNPVQIPILSSNPRLTICPSAPSRWRTHLENDRGTRLPLENTLEPERHIDVG
jgi:hypothetical protein